MGTVIIGGTPRDIDAPTLTWKECGLTFPRLRWRSSTRCVVWHHTAAEGGSARVHDTLVKRGLSVHFVIERDGRVVQFADTETRCSHAGIGNAASIGVEIVNRADERPIAAGVRRQLVLEEIHGRELLRTTFLPVQMSSALKLAELLSEAYDLPMAVPMAGNDVLATAMPEVEAKAFRGHMGHLHWTTNKTDPGLVILRAIAAHDRRKAAATDDDQT